MSYINWGLRVGFAGVAVAAAVAAMTVVTQAAAIGPAHATCVWKPEVLPLPADAEQGQVTAGDGDWLAGVVYSGQAIEGVLWHDGRLAASGPAFGRDTRLHAVNPDGVAVGQVAGNHAVRYRDGRYEYLPATAGRSNALDINPRGDVVGYDGADVVVWQADGVVRKLAVPAGEYPDGRPAIDDDGTVVAWTGRVDVDLTFRRSVYTWAPDGTRTPLADDMDVRDVRKGLVVGSLAGAVGRTAGGHVKTYPGGTVAVAVNRTGTAVGTNSFGELLLWSPGEVPVKLARPAGYQAGEVTTVNDHEAGGYSFPRDDAGSRPVRWVCR